LLRQTSGRSKQRPYRELPDYFVNFHQSVDYGLLGYFVNPQ